jgi:hypothetical protein
MVASTYTEATFSNESFYYLYDVVDNNKDRLNCLMELLVPVRSFPTVDIQDPFHHSFPGLIGCVHSSRSRKKCQN